MRNFLTGTLNHRKLIQRMDRIAILWEFLIRNRVLGFFLYSPATIHAFNAARNVDVPLNVVLDITLVDLCLCPHISLPDFLTLRPLHVR